jgi:hypothetical protein
MARQSVLAGLKTRSPGLKVRGRHSTEAMIETREGPVRFETGFCTAPLIASLMCY